jgi:hypothetical protein
VITRRIFHRSAFHHEKLAAKKKIKNRIIHRRKNSPFYRRKKSLPKIYRKKLKVGNKPFQYTAGAVPRRHFTKGKFTAS